MIDLVYTDQSSCKFEHVIAKRNDDELSVLSALLDVTGDNADVSKIQSGVDLVHHV